MGRSAARLVSFRSPVIMLALFLVVAAAGVGAGALTLGKPPSSAVIATVNLELVYNGLERRKKKEEEFEAKKLEFRTKLETMSNQIKDDRKRFETMPEGPEKKVLGQALVRNAYQLEFDGKFAEQFLDQLYGDMLREMFDEISVACKELAVKSGYTMVMADDSSARVIGKGQAENNRLISLKRFIYVDPAHDVTKELIDMMNNQFAANAGK